MEIYNSNFYSRNVVIKVRKSYFRLASPYHCGMSTDSRNGLIIRDVRYYVMAQ
jgi:uncharacterized protein YxjI